MVGDGETKMQQDEGGTKAAGESLLEELLEDGEEEEL